MDLLKKMRRKTEKKERTDFFWESTSLILCVSLAKYCTLLPSYGTSLFDVDQHFYVIFKD